MVKKKIYNSKPEKIKEAKESTSSYHSMEITFCSSFEEMNEHQYLLWLTLSPEQRIAEATYLLENIFADKIKAGIKNRKIIFT